MAKSLWSSRGALGRTRLEQRGRPGQAEFRGRARKPRLSPRPPGSHRRVWSGGGPGSDTHLQKMIPVLLPHCRQARLAGRKAGSLGLGPAHLRVPWPRLTSHHHPPLILPTGIWSEGADGTDINAVARSHDGKLLASADDFGKVHLFSYPCCQPRVSPPGGAGRVGMSNTAGKTEAALSRPQLSHLYEEGSGLSPRVILNLKVGKFQSPECRRSALSVCDSGSFGCLILTSASNIP